MVTLAKKDFHLEGRNLQRIRALNYGCVVVHRNQTREGGRGRKRGREKREKIEVKRAVQ